MGKDLDRFIGLKAEKGTWGFEGYRPMFGL
jgi:hypothetical protein